MFFFNLFDRVKSDGRALSPTDFSVLNYNYRVNIHFLSQSFYFDKIYRDRYIRFDVFRILFFHISTVSDYGPPRSNWNKKKAALLKVSIWFSSQTRNMYRYHTNVIRVHTSRSFSSTWRVSAHEGIGCPRTLPGRLLSELIQKPIG